MFGQLSLIVAIALGGAVGAVGRHFAASAVARTLGIGFPYGTVTVNIVGCFMLGVLVEILALRATLIPELRAFLVVGVLGGFTTFSAFSLEVALLVERNAPALAFLYVALSVFGALGGMFLGLYLVRLAGA